MTRTVLLLLFAALAWLVWQQPATAPVPATVRSSMPVLPLQPTHSPDENTAKAIELKPDKLWRVVTRRLVTPAAAKALNRRFQELNLEPIMFENREPIEMHAFDDPFLFSDYKKAIIEKNNWLKENIEANVIKVDDDHYMVALGRFFQTEYAEGIQKRLKKIGKPYRYQRRNVPIPTWRFTFAASGKQQAEIIWKQLQTSGISMPVLMPENRFQETYADRKEEPQL
jgi:hypothetical protein